jgi:hypothetical protein
MEFSVASKDFQRLVQFVLDGYGDGVKQSKTEDEDVQEFIDNIPAFQVLFMTYLCSQGYQIVFAFRRQQSCLQSINQSINQRP